MRLRLVSLPVSDVDRAKDFYERVGFEERFDGPFGDGRRWCELGLPGDEASVALVTWFDAMPPGSQQGVVLHVDDVAATRERLAGAGVGVSAVREDPWGSSATFRDPDGNGWVLMQPPAGDA